MIDDWNRWKNENENEVGLWYAWGGPEKMQQPINFFYAVAPSSTENTKLDKYNNHYKLEKKVITFLKHCQLYKLTQII